MTEESAAAAPVGRQGLRWVWNALDQLVPDALVATLKKRAASWPHASEVGNDPVLTLALISR